MSNFRPINRDTGFLLPPSVDEWLPQRHLARFVVEVIGWTSRNWSKRIEVLARRPITRRCVNIYEDTAFHTFVFDNGSNAPNPCP